ncbi:MAG: hypothetical protein KAH38_02000, partial [Candidatus Hydrogenedentes bacterium]|nr:hypothetical protein [Candidatus Hydrogenedentota bacterium]
VEDSQWLIINPNELFVTNDLEIERYPVPWEWDYHGEGEYGSFVFAVGLFTVSDGRSSSDSRHDEPVHFATGEILKLIPDKMDTFLKEDGDLGGCTGWVAQDGSIYLHDGAEFYHSIWNQAYPGFSFAGMEAREEIFWAATNGNTGMVQDELDSIMKSAVYPSTADTQNRMNDVHRGTGGIAEIFENDKAGITSITFLQRWHITTGDWDGCNPLHCIGRRIGGVTYAKIIQYDYYNPMFTRVTKDGVTCNCPNPAKCLH